MNYIKESGMVLASSCDGSPVLTTITTFLFYLAINALMAMLETLINGAPFLHWADPIIASLFIFYSAYGVWCCAIYNTKNKE